MPTSARRPVLYITHRVPYPPDKGDRIRNYHLLRSLAARGVPVWLIALADEPVSPEVEAELKRLCKRVELVPVTKLGRMTGAARSALTGGSLSEGAFRSSEAMATVRRWAGEVSLSAAIVSASALAPYLKQKALDQVPRFVDLVDVDSQKWFDFAAAVQGPKRWLYQFEGSRLRKLEAKLPTWVGAVAVVSAAEAKIYEDFAGAGTATVASNGVDLAYFAPQPAQPQVQACVFVGALDYLPNVDAAGWFAREIWPQVRTRFPEAEFWIVGRKPVEAVLALKSIPGVKVVGQVPDVRSYVAQAQVAVVPMRLSRGLQNKVLEALAMEKAVVAAPPALAALQTVSRRDLIAAQTPEEWQAAIAELFESATRRAELGRAGRQYVETHHHWDRCLAPFLDQIVPVTTSGDRS